ncbi:threonine aldolase [Xylariaceae sp. FL0016]|nr:threonine aldolase [Xylariaceae sp. FL0016]
MGDPMAISQSNGAADKDTAPVSSWIGHKGAAAFDFRSDTMTTPTAAMLCAIQTTTLLDDVFAEDPTTIDLEDHIAALTGKEAAVFVLSGTMGNIVALRTLLKQPPHSVLCDHRAHIIKYEAGGAFALTGAMPMPVRPSNGRYLTLEDIQSNITLSDDVHACPTRVISLETPINGLITPLSELQRIAAFARARGILLHCDGARLWESVAAGHGTLPELAACFDTVSLCFSKGLGAPVGSILVGDRATVRHARWVRKSLGGGLRQSGVVAAAARVAVDTTFGTDARGSGGLLPATHDAARRVARLWADRGGATALPVETNMVWLDLDSMAVSAPRFEELGRLAGLKLLGNRLIVHYQIGEESIRRLEGVFDAVAKEKVNGGSTANGDGGKASGPYGEASAKRLRTG